ncbi:hypothetical protein [Alkalihalobacterium elongatum]|nr:hypothetical protein [Alkalihalobacterium elongatum]
MESKPIHYDGSFHNNVSSNENMNNEPFKVTDEMRASISGNPFTSAESE